MRPLHVALVWHMHQPYYKDDLTSTYLLPWVRLRSAKDYHKMPALLDDYPGVRQTFNLVPSLLGQIEDYVTGDYQDLFLNLSRRPAADLGLEERAFVLRWMRESPEFLRVQASPRYLGLAARGEDQSFTIDELRDLQVWFNLAWCDPARLDSDPRLAALKMKDSGYTEGDKEALFAAQLETVSRVIPKYRELADRGQAELTFSPQYHPILPLIAHVASAREGSPGMSLPERQFSHPEDARRQIELGAQTSERLLGRRPRGMWPPELAIGESMIAAATESGVEWLISDEGVLARSLGTTIGRDGGLPDQPELLYQPYRVERAGASLSLVFRDAQLSNLIGFDYQRMPALDAAGDFMGRLRGIREQQGDRDFLVVVALDGENPWEFYPRDGHDFLNALYRELESEPGVITTTVGDFLAEHPERRDLDHVHSGSWIGASLDTWIGDPEHGVAWNLLAETRDWLERRPREGVRSEDLDRAWREILITEGSDWFWWFSRRHDSGMDSIWDNQFRLHLRNVYKLGGAKPPARLFEPIIERERVPERRPPERAISPAGPDDPAWREAGYHVVGSGFGALHKPIGLVQRLLYGCDDDYLHLRVDSRASPAELGAGGVAFWLHLSGPPGQREAGEAWEPLPIGAAAVADLGFDPAYAIRVEPRAEGAELAVFRVRAGQRAVEPTLRTRIPSPFCFSVPFRVLGKRGGQAMELALVVTREGRDIEQIPPAGSLDLRVPRPHRLPDAGGGGRLKVLIAAAEVAPFAKSGGMADVTAALAQQLRRSGHDVRLAMPRHRGIDASPLSVAVERLPVPLGASTIDCAILEGRLAEVPVYFVDCPRFYDRESLYGYGDDDARFVYLSRAMIEMLAPLGFVPDVIHSHDWHTALIPNLLDRLYPASPALAGVATVLTIHNLAHQGEFSSGALHLAGLEPWGLLRLGSSRLDDVVNVLARGVHFTDVFNTVSERYAEEIQTPELGEGMDVLIRLHGHKLYGIVNGIDHQLFDPERDPALPHHYSAADLAGKALDKAALRGELGLVESAAPVIAIISRLFDTKGLDLIERALPGLMALDAQWVVLGTGERRYEDMFRYQASQHPHRVAVRVGFEGRLAQAIYAGADMFLMPSRSEPCGLGQLISLRYGTIPIVRATGGLADTIEDVDPAAGTGFGYSFRDYDPWQLHAAVVRAVESHRHPDFWRSLVTRAMRRDVSWESSARRYVELYHAAQAGHRERQGQGAPGLASRAGARR
ncbi:MAG: glycogen/starch synthase [Candidatus Dormibacteraceae bacterium]